MTDREALAAALEVFDLRFEAQTYKEWSRALPVVLAAARELLAGKKVWWCLEHGDTGNDKRCMWGNWDRADDDPCRMVEALLVIPDEKGER